jgi:hypothetical protein
MMSDLSLPRWIFDPVKGPYYLLAIKPDGTVSVDGGHSTASGVVKARELFKALRCLRIPAGTEYVMLKVSSVPEKKTRINNQAVKQLNDAYETTRSA